MATNEENCPTVVVCLDPRFESTLNENPMIMEKIVKRRKIGDCVSICFFKEYFYILCLVIFLFFILKSSLIRVSAS